MVKSEGDRRRERLGGGCAIGAEGVEEAGDEPPRRGQGRLGGVRGDAAVGHEEERKVGRDEVGPQPAGVHSAAHQLLEASLGAPTLPFFELVREDLRDQGIPE
ncbi:hypothetical protein [Streptomyces sp. NPDC051214]|uniref:hypothetical protein n=1 Tax=Streptomyces sp. NPDC051214 TaxID=3155282 RepID=UPI00342CB042